MRMVPSGMLNSTAFVFLFCVCSNRQKHTEHSAPWLRFTFYDAAMIADDLGDERETKARTLRLCRDEGIEDVRQKIGWNASSIVAHGDFQGQAEALVTSKTHSGCRDSNAG